MNGVSQSSSSIPSAARTDECPICNRSVVGGKEVDGYRIVVMAPDDPSPLIESCGKVMIHGECIGEWNRMVRDFFRWSWACQRRFRGEMEAIRRLGGIVHRMRTSNRTLIKVLHAEAEGMAEVTDKDVKSRRSVAAVDRPIRTTGDVAGVLVAVARDVLHEDLGTAQANTVNSGMKGILKAQEMAQRWGTLQGDGNRQLTVAIAGEGVDGLAVEAKESARLKAMELRRQLAEAEKVAANLGVDLS